MPAEMFWVLAGVFVASEILTIAVGSIAVARPEHSFLMKWVPTLHVYWPLASFAAMKAMWEILYKPFYWDKTEHGHFHLEGGDIWQVRGGNQPRPNRA